MSIFVRSKKCKTIVNKYKYVKSVSRSKFTSVEMITEPTIHIDFEIKDAGKHISFISLSISSDGYVYNGSSGQAYRVKADDRKELFNELLEAVTKEG